MLTRTARRLDALEPSATVAIADRARAMKAEGLNVVDLSGGDPDFPTPEPIVAAMQRAIEAGQTHYVASRGVPELRQAIAAKLERENHLHYDPATEILVTPGAKLALFCAILALVDEGDEVLLPEPAWVSYRPMIKLAGGIPVGVSLSAGDNFALSEELLRRFVGPRTRLIILNTPNNPTGRVYSNEELGAVARVAVDYDLLVISDEIYESILFPPHEHVSLGLHPGMADRTLTVNGFSKAHAMTGWRLGYIAARASLIEAIFMIHQHSATCAPSFVQYAGVAGLEGQAPWIETMRREYEVRRDMVVEALAGLNGVQCPPPEGAFYAFPRVGGDDLEVAERLLSQARVAVTPGSAFGEAGAGHLRLSFATSRERLRQGLDRMVSFFRG